MPAHITVKLGQGTEDKKYFDLKKKKTAKMI